MRPFLFLTALLFTGMLAKAQHNHFVYLQADNKQPFYVKVKGNVYSSSASGYLIIPKLPAGVHELSIGFPKNQWPSQNIPVTIAGKDLGYLLKNFESKGWGLFNIQTMDVVMASASPGSPASVAKVETKTDDFSNALADVVNTPSIKEVKQEEKKPEPAAKKEEPVVATPVITTTEAPKVVETAVAIVAKPQSVVKKIKSTQTGEASNITYLVSDGYGSDTVEISIPADRIAAVPEEAKAKPVEKAREITAAKETGAPKFIEIDLPNPNANTVPGEPVVETKPDEMGKSRAEDKKKVETTAVTSQPSLQMINSDCKTVATEDDFLKTRKKMTAQKSDDDMVNAAKKLFKQKCYSTAQVKNLSVLFLKDEGKYKFFDAIYPFVYDSREFKQLESQLSEEYYISRFRTMIRN